MCHPFDSPIISIEVPDVKFSSAKAFGFNAISMILACNEGSVSSNFGTCFVLTSVSKF